MSTGANDLQKNGAEPPRALGVRDDHGRGWWSGASALATAALACLPTAAGQSTLWEVSGPTDSRFGHAIAIVGDTNGDGYSDVLVGSPGDDSFGEDAGRVVVLSGLDGALLLDVTHTTPGDQLGVAVSGPGDVNGDGFADLLVGAYRSAVNGFHSGRALVFSGLDGAVLIDIAGPHVEAEFGIGVAGVGDVDGDGVGDFAVGAHHSDEMGDHSGSVRVYSGASATLLYLFTGDEPTDDLGHVVAAAGDVDADGVPDIIGGLHDNPDPGQARVYSGATGEVLIQLDGDMPSDFFGHAVASAGDVDGDGHDDLLVGAALDDGAALNAGRALLVSGATGLTLREWSGVAANDQLGLWLSTAGDFDGDGCLDQVLSVPGDDGAGFNAAAARVVSGWDGSVLVDLQGVSQGLRFDVVHDGGVDLDGDGRPEVVTGFPYDDVAGVDTGRVRAWSGALPTWSAVGAGLAGTGGVPDLRGKGLLAPGTPGRLELVGAASGAPALVLGSIGSLALPFKGGTLYAVPPLLELLLATDGSGALLLPWSRWPAGFPDLTQLVFQVALADAGAFHGVALSNALAGVTKG